MLKGIVRLLAFAPFWWALFAAGWGLASHLSTAWQWFAFLAAVLFDLIRTTGAAGVKSYATAGPATLAGPIQPWQEDVSIGRKARQIPTSPEEAAQLAGELWDRHVQPGDEEGWTKERYMAHISAKSPLTWEILAFASEMGDRNDG